MHSLIINLYLIGTIVSTSYSCKFGLISSGGKSGHVGQLPDGQNRIGGHHPPATYEIKDGGINDSNRRGCILTPEAHQFQCNEGAASIQGFSIADSGTLSYNENEEFYACPVSEAEWNIYTVPVAGQLKCVKISLAADGCHPESAPSYGYMPPPSYEYKPSYPTSSYIKAPSYPAPSYGCIPSTITMTHKVTVTETPKGYSGSHSTYEHEYKPQPSAGYEYKGGYYGGYPKYKRPAYGHKYGYGYGKNYGHDYNYGHGEDHEYGNGDGYENENEPGYHKYDSSDEKTPVYGHAYSNVAMQTESANIFAKADDMFNSKSIPDMIQEQAYNAFKNDGSEESKIDIPFPSFSPFSIPAMPSFPPAPPAPQAHQAPPAPQVPKPPNHPSLDIKKFQTVVVPTSTYIGQEN